MKRSYSDHSGAEQLPLPHPVHRLRSVPTASILGASVHDLRYVLLQVPALLTVIGPYVELRVKLTQLPRLHRSFPPLAPACFRSDAVNLSSASLLLVLTATPPRLALLRHVAAIAFNSHAAADTLLFSQRILPLFASPPLIDFPNLHTLALSTDTQQRHYTLSQLFSSSTTFPALQTLRLSTNEPYPSTPNDRWDISPLSRLPVLRSLTLNGVGLSPHSFLFLLCSLSLDTLDLSDRVVLSRLEAEVTELPLAGVVPASTLRTLFLPDYDAEVDGALIDAVLAGLAQLCVVSRELDTSQTRISGERGQGLAHLQVACMKLSDVTIDHIASISSIATLDLVCSPMINVLPLYHSATLTPRLPSLRHLSLTGVSDCEDEIDAQRISAMLSAHLGFYMAYSRQLHILELDVLQLWPYTSEHVMPIIMAALQCPQLRALRLSGERQSHSILKPEQLSAPALLQPHAPLAHLHSLYFDSLPIDEADLSILLDHCPALLDCRLKQLESLAVEDALLTLGGRCRQLRRMEFVLSSAAAGSIIARSIEASVMHRTLFPCLRVLSITADVGADAATQSIFVTNLVRLLHSASQLHYLRLDVAIALPLLAPFVALSSLQAFRAWRRLPSGLQEWFQSGLSVRVGAIGGPMVSCREEAWSEGEMEAVERTRCGWSDEQVSDDTYVFVGAGGRKGFFASIGQYH